MGIDLTKLVTPEPTNPQVGIDRQMGTYKDPVESIPDADRTQESSMPMAPAPSPFKNLK